MTDPTNPPAAMVCAYCREPIDGHGPIMDGSSWVACRDGSGRLVYLGLHLKPRPVATRGRRGAGVIQYDLGGEG